MEQVRDFVLLLFFIESSRLMFIFNILNVISRRHAEQFKFGNRIAL